MKSARRVPRKVGGEEEGGDSAQDSTTSESTNPQQTLQRIDLIESSQQRADHKKVVPIRFNKRPGASKPRKPSTLRASFAPTVDEEDDASIPILTTVKRPTTRFKSPTDLPLRSSTSTPTYTASALAELKSSTPSRPSATSQEPPSSSTTIDIASKFGTSALALSKDPLAANEQQIPSEAEIREKKERRRRLALEHGSGSGGGDDFISLDDATGDVGALDRGGSDSENEGPRQQGSLIIPADELELKSKWGSSRIEHEDEDIAEGFDDFVEDSGRITLKGKLAREQERQRRKVMEEQIKAAQHGYGYGAGASGSDDDEDEEEDEVDAEEAERNRAYELAQTRKGIYGQTSTTTARNRERDKEEKQRKRLEMPKVKPVPVPELKVVVARFAEMVRVKEQDVGEKRKRLERVRREGVAIVEEEVRVKALLKEAGERFEKLRSEATGGQNVPEGQNGALETYRTVAPEAAANVATPAPDSSDDERPAFGGLGSLDGRPTGFSGVAARPKDEDEDEDDYY